MARAYLPKPDADGIVPQFDGYFDLKAIDLTPYKNAKQVGTIYQDYNNEQISSFQVHKQADTLVLMLLLEDLFDPDGSMHLERAGLVCFSHGVYQQAKDILGFFGWSVARPEVLEKRMASYSGQQ